MAIQDQLSHIIDKINKNPTEPAWQKCGFSLNSADGQTVAHRGCFSGDIRENTMAAFLRARELGFWGVELDIRFTKDDQPIVLHDSDGTRVFGQSKIRPSQLTLDELKVLEPQVPSLAEVVESLAGNLHLMIELKEQIVGPRRHGCMQAALAALKPGRDFHFMALDSNLILSQKILEPKYLILIAELNLASCVFAAIKHKIGGIAGHYFLCQPFVHKILQKHNISMGTGFCNSMELIARENNRGVTWIFVG